MERARQPRHCVVCVCASGGAIVSAEMGLTNEQWRRGACGPGADCETRHPGDWESCARCGVPCRFFLSIASSSDLTSSVLPKYFVLNNIAKEGRFLFVRLASLQPRPCPRVPAMALFGDAFACD